MMRTSGPTLPLFFLAAAVSDLGLLSVPEPAAAQRAGAAHYWAINGTTNPVPYVVPPYTCTTNYYVAPNGNNANPGTSGAPWQTISGAVNNLSASSTQAGTCVNIAPGTYTESIYIGANLVGGSDTPAGYLVFRSSTLHGATLQEPYANIGNGATVFIQSSRFIIFDGFEVTGYANVPFAGAGGLVAYGSHHVKFLNNIVHEIGGAGIGSIHSDYISVQGNVVYDTSCCEVDGASAIDFWAPQALDTSPGFHNVISNNIAFNNSEGADGRPVHSEGHGIMLDNFRLDGYTGATLIENNLCYGNGGFGISLYYSNNVTIRNNTSFDNERASLLGFTGSDIFVGNSSNVIGVNNIAVTNITANSKIRSIWDQTWDHTNQGNVWANNLTFDGNPGDPSVSKFGPGYGTQISAANGNILGLDPLFGNVPAAGFTLQDASPAIGAGTAAYGVPVLDLAGNVRSTTVIDIGAFAYSVVPPS
jgi:parallel beta-helix repeat protein